MMEHKRKNELSVAAGLVANMGVRAGMRRAVHYVVEAVRDGKVLWVDEFDNLVVNVGLDDNLDKHFKGSGYTAAWYVGLTDGTPTFAAGDIMSSHAGWVEVTDTARAPERCSPWALSPGSR